ncbi:MAG: hypothetical protein R3C03_20700 [Pirellulaceae bacterium]
MNDFQPLINLIQSTIAPDEWTATQGEGSIIPYLSGVYVDANGGLKKVNRDSIISANANVDFGSSSLRRVSLVGIQREVQSCHLLGKPVPEEIKNLGGIYDLQYLILDRKNQDIYIAGPAGPWTINSEGIAINVATKRPVLALDDLVTCLRAVWFEGGRFGCSITPRRENLAAAQQFLNDSEIERLPLARRTSVESGTSRCRSFRRSRDIKRCACWLKPITE